MVGVMTEVCVAVSYGMGGDSIDRIASNGGGEDYLVSRLKQQKINTLNSVYNWDQTQKIVEDLAVAAKRKAKIAAVGDSLGDNELGDIVHSLKSAGIAVDFIGGFQGSEWGKHTSISDNVKRALIIYNPIPWETFGLGCFPLPLDAPPAIPVGQSLYDGAWRLGNNGKTWVRYVQIKALHPDDWGMAQDIVFAELKQLQAE
jgi:hypothetical protein